MWNYIRPQYENISFIMYFDMNFILISNIWCVSQFSMAVVIVLENLESVRKKRRKAVLCASHTH
jgi:hypothetical protein